MIGDKKVLVIIPARGGSKGLPKKNIKMLADKPLIAWPIYAALGCNEVDKIIVSTDCVEIAKVARDSGAEVPFMRPAELSGDRASSMDVVIHAITMLEDKGDYFDYVVMLEPTSPLTESNDLSQALKLLTQSSIRADAIVGISCIEATHPEFSIKQSAGGLIKPAFAKNFSNLKRRQDVDELYFLEGSLYISSIKAFKLNKTFYGETTLGYVVPRWKSFEIDELVDFFCIEAILNNRDSLRTS
ncbi:acylneuraminate cytidylyltransferase family protein [Amylibacter sp.]|nr:acylneuraminate cytidylyltransferase family protein [Amylibacter sp.]